jgi:hypothetical protein
MLKKLTLLAMAVGALVVFAAPAMAQADEWYTTGAGPGGTDLTIGPKGPNDDTVTLTGRLTSTTGGAAGVHVDCEVESKVTVWNEPSATAEVTEFNIFVPTCETNIPGCELENAEALNLSWHVDPATGATATKITEAAFFNEFNGVNCETFGHIPQHVEIVAEGTATGTWNNTGGCIEFSEDGDMVLQAEPLTPVLLDGSICNANLTLK